MIDDGTITEAYIHSLTLSFPHIIKAEEIELEGVGPYQSRQDIATAFSPLEILG